MDVKKMKPARMRGIVRAVLQGAIGGILLGAAFTAGYLYRDMSFQEPTPEQSSSEHLSLDLIIEADTVLRQYYLYDMPGEETRIHGAIRGLVASLDDPYTFFVEPQTAEIDSTNLAGHYGGIGVEITRDEQGRFVISQVYRDNPAYEAGVQVGDIILAVDGVEVDVRAPDMNGLLSAIRGEVGDPVTLTFSRGEDTYEVEIIRAEVLIPSAFWRILEEDTRVGYIQIVRFTERTPEEVKQAIGELGEQGAQAFILDLRNNGGGLVSSATGVADEFLGGGVILYEQRQGEREEVYNASRGGSALNIPLVVLVNQNTASASEIVAGAFQDRGRATLIGQQSFGKGSVQVILQLSDASSIHVTSAQWFTPDHHRIENMGLMPDIIIEPMDGYDAELAAALEFIVTSLPVAGLTAK